MHRPETQFGIDPINPVSLLMKLVVAEFVLNEQHDDET
jgi:hypothetical protein